MNISSHLQDFIKLGDSLRDLGIESEISLPRICVIGTQSAGKSSLLESIVGYDFLPRGEGVVTRMPLELRLVRLPVQSGEEPKPYAKFKGETETIEDLSLLRDLIEKKQEQIGDGKQIIDKPIVLIIYSPFVPDLSLVDLPGITRVPIGNQPKNIEEITKDISRRYIKDERTIILCVTPASVDLTTSDSIQMAQQFDPTGSRTLGVITKIDLMDRGTDAMNILENKAIPLKHGYIAVKNRSQEDINKKMSVKIALEKEEEWFAGHEKYSHVLDRCGSKRLAERLSQLLYQHILNNLPNIAEEI